MVLIYIQNHCLWWVSFQREFERFAGVMVRGCRTSSNQINFKQFIQIIKILFIDITEKGHRGDASGVAGRPLISKRDSANGYVIDCITPIKNHFHTNTV